MINLGMFIEFANTLIEERYSSPSISIGTKVFWGKKNGIHTKRVGILHGVIA